MKFLIKKAGQIIVLFSLGVSIWLSLGYQEDKFTRLRKRMVEEQLASRDITDKRVLEVMGMVPRHLFVLPQYINLAYEDTPLPIEEGQTISQPYIVALMTQCLALKGDERVLEIGTGSGYQAAILAHLCREVYTIEIRESLARKAADLLARLGYQNVYVKGGDGYFGWPEKAPFDAIIVTCAANHLPPPLLEQLKDGGRLVIPLGSTLYFQTLTLVIKEGKRPRVEYILGVRFVPMIGEAEKKKR
ncbi:MAG: protein-L-isoaspartate(D-aspartate) O-methyltransferase [Candidatus Aminicenantes bacterium]|nr:protein-L-isoaspartate(D-aspartate) O-methyltransferase [Candidatus Aminicenantes bacterium]